MTSEDIREELARIAPVRACDRLAELSALFHSAGNLHLRGKGKWALHLDLASGAAARRAFSLLRDVEIRSEIRTYRRRAFDRATRFQLHVEGSDEALRIFAAAGVLDRGGRPLERPPRRVIARACCRSAYLRGAFLGGGSLSAHRSPHLELRTAAIESATLLSELAGASDTQLSIVERPTYAAAYAKSWDSIESVLALAGAAEAVLALEERAVVTATSGHANRRANADHANLVRTSKAAQLQLEAVRRLKAAGRIERLEAPLREVAELRLHHPTESLRELAARTDPPVTRAAVHRRLHRLEELASGVGASMPR
ncbi:MAG: DNA-binding protein WhiA [Actinobacteria bacterium]|nr:DNA-binding protein WhiA [Actinomycetota bacterium]MBA3565291.1 DNA-binding protein WhiA [Actinomycetota bacterium]MDQ3085885.1 DNA-binding protein WhiA [Actinomycetota bacterium]MDQ3425321.1 DNA-binding protein WhiA [Actinomycetota bacterium]